MGPLATIEHFLERLFEGQSARLFRTAIRPIQVQRRLERTMEEARRRDGSRTVVPHRFVVRLQPDDLAALGSADRQLAASLADNALAFARAHGYTLLDRPSVSLRADPSVAVGDIAIDGSVDASPDAELSDAEARSFDPVIQEASTPDQTAVYVVPAIDGPLATIREIRPDRSSRTVRFDGRPLTIGRASDNGLVLRDGRASRHHARIDGRRGTLVLTDLRSTNGSFVNDRRIDSIALGEGDRIRLGTTTLVLESIDDLPNTDERASQPDDDPARA
jgi:hypothetical protein